MQYAQTAAEQLTLQARVAIADRRWEDALAFCEGALQLAPRHAEARTTFREALSGAGWMESPASEQRVLAVMFCDLERSTEVASSVGAEAWAERLREYHDACGAIIVNQFDGRIDKYLGDGILAYFGYPRAHNNDSAAALFAGLAILDRLRGWSDRLAGDGGVRPGIRIGVHTGPVLLSDVGGEWSRGGRELVGDTPNIAARLQEVARADTLVASEETIASAGAGFTTRRLPPTPLRGVRRPPQLFEVTTVARGDRRLEASPEVESPLVGRDLELAVIRRTLDRAREGAPAAVLVTGESGVGKSRLAREGAARFWAPGGESAVAGTSEYQSQTAFFAIARLVRRLSGIESEDSAGEAIRKLASRFEQDGADSTALVPLVATLLQLPLAQSPYPEPELGPRTLHERAIEGIAGWLARVAARKPLLCLIEDLHWADASSREVIAELLGRQIPGLALLLTARVPEFDIEAFRATVPAEFFEVVALEPLPLEAAKQIVAHRLGGSPDDPVVASVARDCGGNPLFAEELAALTARGALSPSSAPVPARLSNVLTARLDRVGRHRPLIQAASIVGEEVPRWLLREISNISETELDDALATVADSDVLRPDRSHTYRSYRFRHELLRRTAYLELPEAERSLGHGRVADALERRGGQWDAAEIVARHREEAGQHAEAARRWIEAAERAAAIGSTAEAMAHYSRVIPAREGSAEPGAAAATAPVRADVARRVPLLEMLAPEQRFAVDLRSTLGRGGLAAGTLGYHHPSTVSDFAHAFDVCRLGGGAAELLPAIIGLWTVYLVRADFQTCSRLVDQMRQASSAGGDTLAAEVASCVGYQLFYTGDFRAARAEFDRGLRLFADRDAAGDAAPTILPLTDAANLRKYYGAGAAGDTGPTFLPQDVRVANLTLCAITEWILGDGEAAVARANAAQLHAEALATAGIGHAVRKHHYSTAYASLYDAWRLGLAGEFESSAAAARQAIGIAEEHGLLEILLPATIHLAIASSHLGPPAEALPMLEAGVGAWQAGGAGLLLSYFVAQLADARWRAGDLSTALLASAEAARIGAQDGMYGAEIARIGAGIRRASGAPLEETLADLGRARDLARSAGAIPFELAATLDLLQLRPAPEPRAAVLDLLGRLRGLDESAIVRRARAALADGSR